jgi:NAD-dependent deacetylase
LSIEPALVTALRRARRVVFFTGAGVSSESGLPTFRDAQSGLWAQYRPQDLATPEAFARDPETVWRWYQWRRRVHSAVAPNPAHRAIAAIQQALLGASVVTQNVDRLHEMAGSVGIVHLHGTLFRNRCSQCHRGMPEVAFDLEVPPLCDACGGLCRPDIVWFGEGLPKPAWEAAVRAVQEAEIVFSIGTSATVHPAAELPRMAERNGALVVQINPEPTPLDPIAHNLRGTAATILPELAAAWFA